MVTLLALFRFNGSCLKVASCTGIKQTVDYQLVHAKEDVNKVKKETNQSV